MTRRAPSHRGRTVALCAAAALFVAAAPAFAQQDDGGASKRGGRIRIGGGVLGGDLTFVANGVAWLAAMLWLRMQA